MRLHMGRKIDQADPRPLFRQLQQLAGQYISIF